MNSPFQWGAKSTKIISGDLTGGRLSTSVSVDLGVGQKDPRSLRVHRLPAKRDVPYVPTDDAVVPAILRLAKVTADDVIYDLGCGDGRIVIAAAKRFGARGVGVEIDPMRIEECHDNLRRAGVGDRVQFLQKSFFDVDLSPASVVTLYLLPSLNIKLRPKLLAQLKPGSCVISNHFDMADWQPDEIVSTHHRNLHRWMVPANVRGEWHCSANDHSDRRRIVLKLTQSYQIVTGRAAVCEHEGMIGLGRLAGDELTFRLVEWGRGGAIMRYWAKVTGDQIRGRCWAEGEENKPVEWGGFRRASKSLHAAQGSQTRCAPG